VGLFGRRRPVDDATPQAEVDRDAAWSMLPALAPSLPPMPLTFGTDSFEAELPTRDRTRFVGPLAHAVSPEAPAGVIAGLIEPVVPPRPAVRNDGPPLTVAARPAPGARTVGAPVVARRAHNDATEPDAAGLDAAGPHPAVPDSFDPGAVDAGATEPITGEAMVGEEPVPLLSTAPPLVRAPTPPELPARALPVVPAAAPLGPVAGSPSNASPAGALPTTAPATPVVRPRPPGVQRAPSDAFPERPPLPPRIDAPVLGDRAADVSTDALVPTPPATDLGQTVAGASSPVERLAAGAVASPVAAAATVASPVAAAAAVASPAPVATSPARGAPAAAPTREHPPVQRRLGLGAPLPPSTVPPAGPGPVDAPVSAPSRVAPATPTVLRHGPPVATPSASPGPAAEVDAEEGRSRLPVGLAAPLPAEARPVVATSISATDADVVQRAAPTPALSGPGPLTLPTLGTRARAELGRALEAPATDVPTAPVDVAPAGPPPVTQRSPAAPVAAPSHEPPAPVGPTTARPEPSTEVAAAPSPTPTTPTVRPLLAGTPLPPVVDWTKTEPLIPPPPPPTSGAPLPTVAPPAMGLPAAAAAPPVAARLAAGQANVQRTAAPLPPLSAPPRPVAGGAADATPAQLPIAPTPAQVAAADGLGEVAADGSIVFHPPADEPTVQLTASEALSAPAVQAAPSPAAPAPGHHDESEKLHQLAKQLYDSIRDQLKAELRLDRERWGRVTDIAR
jgi:hypothetical protein